jgi:cell division protease FtsH
MRLFVWDFGCYALRFRIKMRKTPLILAALVALIAVSACAPQDSERVPYSFFKEQLEADNVREVTIRGEALEGRLSQSTGNLTGTTPRFHTRVPPFGDERLLEDLGEAGVTVWVEDPGGSFRWTGLLIYALPVLLILGLILYARRKGPETSKANEALTSLGKSRARRYEARQGGVTFADVQGVEEAKRELVQVVEFLKDPRRFRAVGSKMPRGVLLVGPPGTGKTLMARAVAGEAEVPFFSINGSEFMEVFVGLGASRVRDLFREAKEAAPSILFVDELDAVGRRRTGALGAGNEEKDQTLNQLLSEMDGFEPHDAVVVLAATNRPDVLDPALTRPGRFDRQVVVDLPDRGGREVILGIHARNVPTDEDVDLKTLARATPGFAGADLANLVNEAALAAAEEGATRVNQAHFAIAREKIMLGPRRPLLLSDEQRRLVAYHEAGHALVGHLLPGADPIEVVTIVPHGRSLGATQQMADEDRYNLSKSIIEDRLAVMLAGRAAEKAFDGEPSTGSENDIREATRLARKMVLNLGHERGARSCGLRVLRREQLPWAGARSRPRIRRVLCWRHRQGSPKTDQQRRRQGGGHPLGER